jgi:hypothetical protein
MYSDYLFTVENVRKAWREYDYERYTNQPVGWCIEQTRDLTDERIKAGLSKHWALDLIYPPEDIVVALNQPESEVLTFIQQSATDVCDQAIATAAMAGALLVLGQHVALIEKALLRLSADTLLRHIHHTEVLSI